MQNVVKFRQFKIPAVETQFFQSDLTKHVQFAVSDLARSGLVPDDMEAYTSSALQVPEGAEAAYVIPYYHLDGTPIVDADNYPAMYRVRLKVPEFSRNPRYTQPGREQLAKLGLPPYVPYIPKAIHTIESKELICAEGEKKAQAIVKYLGLPAFGIGGCWLWKNPDGSGGIHPWIRDLLRLRGADTVTIVPDGDVRRYDIAQAYGNFARALANEGVTVRLLEPTGKIDDLLVEWGPDANDRFRGIIPIPPEDLVQTPASLIKEYGLAFRAGADGKPPTVHQHISNILRLVREHPAFPHIWKNLDNQRVYIDDIEAVPDMTEVHMTEYFQHNLGFDKVKPNDLLKVIQTLAKENAKSPFLDRLKGLEWDGKPRLDTWLTDHWGVEDTPYHREVSSKWLISSCARLDKPGTKIDWIFIVIGPQATGKTTMPKVMFYGQNKVLYGEQNDKDFHMLLHSAVCIGLDELDTFNRKESSTLKAMVTRDEDSFRPPYGSTIEVFPRRFTLYGCGNRHDFLQHDSSGYRRYAIVTVNRLIDFSRLQVERDQLWAEAWGRYQHSPGEFWKIEGASENAQNYVAPNPLVEGVEEFLARKQADKMAAPGKIYFTMKEIQIHLGLEKIYGTSSVIKDLSQVLEAAGAIKPTKASRHPDTGGVARWYTWEPPAL